MILGFLIAPLVYSIIVNTMLAIGVSYLASLMMRKPKQFSPDIGNYPQQTAMKGLPIQKVYGTRRVAGNILWMKDLGEVDIGGGIMVKRKSYLIGICEGPATVLRYWLGPTLQAGGRKHYFFDGDETGAWIFKGGKRIDMPAYSTARDLTGEEFGDYENLCCCFIYDQLSNMDGSPPEFTFEVSSYSKKSFFVGINPQTGNQLVCKVGTNSVIDTTWGDAGYWDSSPDLGPCYSILHLEDGRLLVGHNYYKVTMINTDGTTDTTWATNGTYTTPTGSAMTVWAMLEDNDGNFHLFGGVAGATTNYTYVKISSAGTFLGGLTRATTKIWNFYDAIWDDEAKTRIIAVGAPANGINSSLRTYTDLGGGTTTWWWPTMIAIDPDTATIDTTWTGNIPANLGYAHIDPNDYFPADIHRILKISGGYATVCASATQALVKVLSDGSGLDTSWGTGGIVNIGTAQVGTGAWPITQAGDELYTVTLVGGVNTLYHIDVLGRIVDSYTITGHTGYYLIAALNGKLVLGTTSGIVASNNVEIWSKTFEYKSGFAIANCNYPRFIFADAVSEVVDDNPALMVRDLATDARYGAGLDAAYVDDVSVSAVQAYCDENDIKISLVIKDAKPLVDYIDQILAHCNGYRHWSGGKLKLGVFKDEDAVDPPITQDDLVVEGDEEPVTIAPRKRSETFNRVRVGWSNRANDYDFSSEIAEDQVDQRIGDEVRLREVDLNGICRIELARKIAQRGLFESMYRYNFYTFRVGYKHSLMEVGDVKLLSDGGQIVNQKIRILSIKEEKDGRTLAVEAIEEAAGLYLSTSYDSQAVWTASETYPTESIIYDDYVCVVITPEFNTVSDNVNLSDYAHLEVA